LENWEIASILGHNDPPAADEPGASRPVADGPDAFNVRRMMAEAAERGEVADVPGDAAIVDLIRRGKAG
jgi:hypothetical protein